MENLLAVMMRVKNARNLASRHAAAVDEAYFATKPPTGGQQRRRRPPMQVMCTHVCCAKTALVWLLQPGLLSNHALQEYIRHLIFDRLDDGSIVAVLRKLMKLPWQESEGFVLKCLLKVRMHLKPFFRLSMALHTVDGFADCRWLLTAWLLTTHSGCVICRWSGCAFPTPHW